MPWRPRLGIATAELEVGWVEGAGVQAFSSAGMNPSDEALRELLGRHPHVRGNSRVFGCKFGSESSFPFCHSFAALRKSTRVPQRYRGKFRPVFLELEPVRPQPGRRADRCRSALDVGQSLKVVIAVDSVVPTARETAPLETGVRKRRGIDRCGRASRAAPCYRARSARRASRGSRTGGPAGAYWWARKQWSSSELSKCFAIQPPGQDGPPLGGGPDKLS